MNSEGGQLTLFGPDLWCGRMCQERSAQETQKGKISASSSRRSSGLKEIPFMSLDLTPGHGNLLGESYWELSSPWRGGSSTLNTGPAPPSGAAGCSLSRILVDDPPERSYLTRRACQGILRRARERGKPLPRQLELALKLQAGIVRLPPGVSVKVFLESHTLTAGFNAGAGATAGSLGYQEEAAPTLKGVSSGNMMPTVFCLNDQGGQIMDVSENVTGTLRAQERGHQPLIFENYGIDGRYKGPFPVAPAVTARYGTGGNNTTPALYSRQRVDEFKEDGVTSTERARQQKGATDLIVQESNEPEFLLIRKLLPLECERLQGYPDGWTDLPGASDSARYRGLGNSVAIPCVEYIMNGIAMALCGRA